MFTVWKLAPIVVILLALLVATLTRPPRTPVGRIELTRLVAAVAALYLVGAAALLAHRTVLAGIVFGSGLAVCSLALWLSRGSSPPRDDDDDGGLEPDPSPDLPPSFDWEYYEDQFGPSSPSGDPDREPLAPA